MDDHSSRNIFHAVIELVAKHYQRVPERSFKLWEGRKNTEFGSQWLEFRARGATDWLCGWVNHLYPLSSVTGITKLFRVTISNKEHQYFKIPGTQQLLKKCPPTINGTGQTVAQYILSAFTVSYMLDLEYQRWMCHCPSPWELKV